MPVRLALVAIAALRVAADNVSTSKLDPELRVGDLAASEIAVHILATSKTKSGRAGGADYDYVEERLLAGARTWGRGFPRLSYIVGSSDDLDDMSTRLSAAGPCAKEPRDCGQRKNSRNGDGCDVSRLECSSFSVVRFRNCTSDYYGTSGPCCRCQESMRHMIHLMARGDAWKWWVFADDDMYMRAPAIVAMLSKHDHNQPLAVVSDGQIRGLTPSFFRSRSPDCASPDCVFRFPWAQPAILSRGAMIKLMDVVHKNLLTQECKAFDVTHDVGLGMIMWIASLPFVAVGEYQGEMAAARNRPRDGLATKPPSDLDALMHVHGVRRMGGAELIGGLGASGSQGEQGSFSAVHAHLAEMDAHAGGAHAIQLGFKAAARPVVAMNGYNSTALGRARWESGKRSGLEPFLPGDCSRIDVAHVLAWCTTTSIHRHDRTVMNQLLAMNRSDELRKSLPTSARRLREEPRAQPELRDALWFPV